MKKSLSLMLALIMMLCMIPSAAFALTEPDVWDGTADTTWYNDTDTEFVLTTAEQLAGLADLVDGGNTFEGKTIKLGSCLDLYVDANSDGDPDSFDPIGYGYGIVFKGTFDGQGHTISNLYQNGWSLGLSYSTAGGGLFASVVDATFKDLRIDNAEVVMECIDMGILVGYSYGTCSYENITITNSLIANYQRYTGGLVGEVNGTQTFTNIDIKDTVISSLWGDFDCSLGGIIGGKWGDADVTIKDCDIACEINAYSDVTSTYQWYAYRRAGMLIGNTEQEYKEPGSDRKEADATWLKIENCTVTYGDWNQYTYCEFAGTSWPYVRVQAGYSTEEGYSNPRYGHPKDANGNTVIDDNHVHNDGEDHFILIEFKQLYGGGQGVYGAPERREEHGDKDELLIAEDFDDLRTKDPDNDLFNIPSPGHQNSPAPAPEPAKKSGSIKVTYNGGNSFSTSKSAVPTSVEIDGAEVPFTGNGSSFTVGCIDPNAKWVTVRWNSTSVTVSFKPDVNVVCTEVMIPKTGDVPLWAAVAQFFGF